MRQCRLHFTAERKSAERASRVLEPVCEESCYPLALSEVPGDPGLWTLSIYVAQEQHDVELRRLQTMLRYGGFEIVLETEALRDTDWVAHSLEGLRSVRAGRFVVVGSHARQDLRPHDTGIVIDAGQAFGTGHHGTTAGCLEAISNCLKRRRFANALDLGTGSGVLAIALAIRQPGRILASDIDPIAIRVARDNARRNGAGGRIAFVTAAGFGHRRFAERKPFDLVVANILAGPLQQMARDLSRHLKNGAILILSGLLPYQQARIVAHYRAFGVVLKRACHRDGWLVLVMEKA
jgi:ribosomal protein L11 methyltransferase